MFDFCLIIVFTKSDQALTLWWLICSGLPVSIAAQMLLHTRGPEKLIYSICTVKIRVLSNRQNSTSSPFSASGLVNMQTRESQNTGWRRCKCVICRMIRRKPNGLRWPFLRLYLARLKGGYYLARRRSHTLATCLTADAGESGSKPLVVMSRWVSGLYFIYSFGN